MATKNKVRELKWPALGVVRRSASAEGPPQFQEPFPTVCAVNCRPEDTFQQRLCGGSRPGLTVYRGHPIEEEGAVEMPAALRNLSRGIGVIDPLAWCVVQDVRTRGVPVKHAFVFLSSVSLFMIAPSGDSLQPLCEDRLPEELACIPDTTAVSLVYSPEERGIYIFMKPAEGTATHWFFDLVHQGFWPLTLQAGHQPLWACYHDGDVLLGCKDGVVRSIGGDDDDGESIASYVLIGPLRLGGPGMFGLVVSIRGHVADGSGNVSWRIIPGDTDDEACRSGVAAVAAYIAGDTAEAENYTRASGTLQPGRPLTRYPRVRAKWMCLLLKASGPWGYDSITVESRDAGSKGAA